MSVGNFDLFSGILKSFFFGAALGLISCYKGFYCRAGAEGVGRACTEAFVTSFMAILTMDYFLAEALQSISIKLYGFRTFL
jgi:phospholipid/cholesterol/gamma-HCH transport system permease protein